MIFLSGASLSPWVPSGCLLGASQVPLGVSWVPSGCLWVPSGCLWVLLGGSWVTPGCLWVPPGCFLGAARVLGLLGSRGFCKIGVVDARGFGLHRLHSEYKGAWVSESDAESEVCFPKSACLRGFYDVGKNGCQ